ncbi:hypothetical protein AB0M39_40955 [Streptomyces sp. NPDC051907]|uniref:hypothetical protein n=1 Tax=Streptomyces sp. NPDC051907 TaxID=3155284 RepID=UPI00343F8333
MATTRYVVAATASSPEVKIVSNLKAARAEADARAKLDRVDVEVRTQATDKVSYTAKGAPVAETPVAPAVDADDTTHVTETAADTDEAEAALAAAEAADPELAAMVAAVDEPAADEDDLPEPDADTKAAFDAALAAVMGEVDTGAAATAPAAEDSPADQAPAEDKDADRRAACGCLVEKIIASGEHGKGCTQAPAVKAKAASVAKDPQPRQAAARRTGNTGRREALGKSAVDGWELLYDKPRQKAQVGRKDGKYALICTDHKHAHPLNRLVQERGLRSGKRSVWCPECTN